MSLIKFELILFLCVVAFLSKTNGLTDDQIELINTLHAECSSETGATEGQIANAKKGNFADDIKLKCYIKCVHEEVGLLNDDGTVDVDGIISIIPDDVKMHQDKILSTIVKCNIPNKKGVCETIWDIHKCYYSKNPQIYFLP